MTPVKKYCTRFGFLALCWLCTPSSAFAEPVFMELHCFKASSAFYEDLERDTWKPIHQKMVSSGNKLWWGVFAVVYGDKSQCDYYSLDVYSDKQFKSEPAYFDVIQSLYPDNGFAAVWEKTFKSRSEVATSLWMLEDETKIVDFQWAKINWMKVPAKKTDAYLGLEKNQFKPVYQKLVEDQQLGGWQLFALLAPEGSQIEYNYMTLDLWKNAGPPDYAQAFALVHPKGKIETAFKNVMASRDLVTSQVLRLVVSTSPGAP